jgi:hypothetical protein
MRTICSIQVQLIQIKPCTALHNFLGRLILKVRDIKMAQWFDVHHTTSFSHLLPLCPAPSRVLLSPMTSLGTICSRPLSLLYGFKPLKLLYSSRCQTSRESSIRALFQRISRSWPTCLQLVLLKLPGGSFKWLAYVLTLETKWYSYLMPPSSFSTCAISASQTYPTVAGVDVILTASFWYIFEWIPIFVPAYGLELELQRY